MRLVAGTHGGRRLRAPAGDGTRPTADRAREGLFSSLQSLLDLDGARVLDLYAGSGALGLPAVVVDADVTSYLGRPPEPFDLVLLDPPYELDVDPVLALLAPWLAPGAVVVVERRTRGPAPVPPAGLEPLRHRRYGEATLWYFRAP